MKLIFIRHGDPDYDNDCVTEKGKKEVEYLADMLQQEDIDEFYVSPLGRARDTADATLKRIGKKGIECLWLKEFDTCITMPITGEKHLIWDFKPSFLEKYPKLYLPGTWQQESFIAESKVPQDLLSVYNAMDKLLASYGYIRDGLHYKVEKESHKTLAFFCHFGVAGIILSHLFNFSPIAFLQHFSAAPSSVTTIYTEEREQGIAAFRCAGYGDISHLYMANEPPSFAGRFAETFSDFTRH